MAVILFRFDKSATEVNNQIQNLFKILGYDINPWVVLVLKVRVYILRLFSLQYSDVVNQILLHYILHSYGMVKSGFLFFLLHLGVIRVAIIESSYLHTKFVASICYLSTQHNIVLNLYISTKHLMSCNCLVNAIPKRYFSKCLVS